MMFEHFRHHFSANKEPPGRERAPVFISGAM